MLEVNVPVNGRSLDQKLFGKFFDNVDKCRGLMRENQMVASGSAVLWSLEKLNTWLPGDLDFFVKTTSLGSDGLFDVHDFLVSEGYVLSCSNCRESYNGLDVSSGCVLFCFILLTF